MGLRKYTQEEFDAFPIDEYGRKHCPTGDYSDIQTFLELCSFGGSCSFGEWCSFGEQCSFGERCSFGEWCSFGESCSHERLTNSTYFACDRIGSEKRKTYFFKADEGYFVRAGCFFGTLDSFVERVKQVHSVMKYEREYLLAAELAKVVLDGEVYQ